MTGRRSWLGLLVALVAAGLLWWQVGSTPTEGGSATDPASGLPWVAEADLPSEARETLALVDAGGPYPFEQDDGTFFNREELLPDHRDGYYREYTVVTPGSDDRGARRIVTGAEGEYYWTEDHYASFERIAR
jgi:ribonuclease T1